ncbi:MAG: aldose 1-epimerase family protein [Planctomycetota bacterium]
MKRVQLLVALMAVLTLSAPSTAHDDYRFVLTDSATNTHTDSFSISARDLGIKGDWSVRKETLKGGKQDGVDLITIDNGKLKIRVIPTRGMGILDVTSGDVRLGWNSPVKEVVHPKYVDLDTRGGLGWLDGFNEWMVRCGLEFAGHPGEDSFTTNTGATATMDLTLHGKIGNIPASSVEILIGEDAPHTIRVRGVVHERLFFGPKLELATEISTTPGSDTFRIDDRVTNRGAASQEFEIIYHGNYGRPILGEGSVLHAATKSVAPMNDHAAPGVRGYHIYKKPTPGWVEEVYLLEPYSDAKGMTSIMLQNPKGDVGTSVTWSTSQLPYLTVWKNTTAEADGYVTGLEPGTNYPFNRSVERKAGRLPVLKPGVSRKFGLEFGIHTGKAAVTKAANKVKAIANGRPTKYHEAPPKVD